MITRSDVTHIDSNCMTMWILTLPTSGQKYGQGRGLLGLLDTQK